VFLVLNDQGFRETFFQFSATVGLLGCFCRLQADNLQVVEQAKRSRKIYLQKKN